LLWPTIDFSNAFDLIDNNILLIKFVGSGVSEHITVWSLDFLNDRKQFVKDGESVSSTTTVRAGTSQVTVCGPKDFRLTSYHHHCRDFWTQEEFLLCPDPDSHSLRSSV